MQKSQLGHLSYLANVGFLDLLDGFWRKVRSLVLNSSLHLHQLD